MQKYNTFLQLEILDFKEDFKELFSFLKREGKSGTTFREGKAIKKKQSIYFIKPILCKEDQNL